jgi:hypothetical protein
MDKLGGICAVQPNKHDYGGNFTCRLISITQSFVDVQWDFILHK